MDMKRTVIYYLVDPVSMEVRYVGKTIQKLESRITAHMRDRSDCHRVHWLDQLRAQNLRPLGFVVSEIEGPWPWQAEEIYWIAKLKSMGARLTNNTAGGDGVTGLSEESRLRIVSAWKGRKHTPETIEKLRIARRKRITSEETKRKMSRSQKGRTITWGKTIAESVRKLTPELADAIVARIKAGETVQSVATDTGIHRTTISKVKAGTYFTTGQK